MINPWQVTLVSLVYFGKAILLPLTIEIMGQRPIIDSAPKELTKVKKRHFEEKMMMS